MITVIAGVNGSGKSSIVGAYIRQAGGDFCNPDEITRTLLAERPALAPEAANAEAWQIGFRQLQRAMERDDDYTFETTLGGNSIRDALLDAAERGRAVRVIYVGLESVALHLERVAARVARGGHPIPEERIRRRWESSRYNLTQLIPQCHAVRVIDNSAPMRAGKPRPRTLFHLEAGRWITPPRPDIPEWARPLAVSAMRSLSEAGMPEETGQ